MFLDFVNSDWLIRFLNYYVFILDIGSNNSGYYELIGVLTHKGRSSSSGHYVAWIRRKKGKFISIIFLYLIKIIDEKKKCGIFVKHKTIFQLTFKVSET